MILLCYIDFLDLLTFRLVLYRGFLVCGSNFQYSANRNDCKFFFNGVYKCIFGFRFQFAAIAVINMKSIENEPLVQKYDEDYKTKLYLNFVVMSLAFSANHGSVVACLAYASAQLGDSLGSYGSGSLYVCYAFTSFLFAKPVTTMVGPKNGLLIGVGGYCVYILGFLLAIIAPAVRWPVFLIACIIGGTAGGFLWTAQGRYFARNAKLYADYSRITPEEANASFAGIFAACYLGLEMITKVIATVVFLTAPGKAPFIVFTIYTCIAVVATFFVYTLESLGETGTRDFDTAALKKNTTAASMMLYSEPRLSLLVPFQLAFGFASSFVPFYVFGTIIADSDQLGSTWVGLLSAVVVFTGAVTAIPAGKLANQYGKPLLMTIGGTCLALSGVAFLMFSDETLGTWQAIVPFLVIYGMGRGTWVSPSHCHDTAPHCTALYCTDTIDCVYCISRI